MVIRFRDLWHWDGRIRRLDYALVGFIGFAIKHNLDRFVAWAFHRQWEIFNYWVPLDQAVQISKLSHQDVIFLATLLALALPFIWIGVGMTVRRLRDAAQPVWLVALFFIPLLNVPFFVALCCLPTRESSDRREAAPWPGPRALDDLIPKSRFGSAFLSIVLTAVLGLLFVLLGTQVLGQYGWGLFVALPFCLGLFSVLLYSYHEPRKLGPCVGVSLLPIAILGGVLLLAAVEGFICVLMAAPLAMGLALLGGGLGYSIQKNHWWPRPAPGMLSLVLLITPALFGLEHYVALQPPTFAVRTSIEINAPPEKVWRKVVAFTEIPPPQELLFRSGIAYPIRAEISGHGPGAIRNCVFSTGPFVEPIQVWDEPWLLRFSVTENPAPMHELSPYGNIQPPHLRGYFVSHQGQFALTPLPDGRTLVEGTTWYSDTMWPTAYWHLWSDYIIHRIHLRVLNHIRMEAEKSAVGQ